jgi:xanthine dehydrogenase YagR molybdenum-binding subunit
VTTIEEIRASNPAGIVRVEGPDKVSGRARYAVEHPVDELAYVWPVPATVAKGTVLSVDGAAALSLPGVLAVLTPGTAPRLVPTEEGDLALFQSADVAYRGQFVAAVVAATAEAAREAAGVVAVEYRQASHDVMLTAEHPGLYAPAFVNPRYDTDSLLGDVDAALASAAVQVDETYTTPVYHNHPMEPHATLAVWDGDALTVHTSTQGAHRAGIVLAALFGIERSQVRVVAEHVGGGFGSKGMLRPEAVLAVMAARVVNRPVRCALTRQQMVAVVGHRTPSIQRVRLGADVDGRLAAVSHEVFEQSSTIKEFAEQTAVATRHMYAAPNRRTTHRVVRLDVPTPSWVRAPGECPGMYALESAMDELAIACRVDPVELRIRNEPSVDPETGRPWSSRNLVACLREGAERFGWAGRDATPRTRREGRWLRGTGMAASTYPARAMGAHARASIDPSGSYEVAIAAVDIGTGARTALTIVAAEALGVGVDQVRVLVGDSDLPESMLAGGSMGMASWSWAVTRAGEALKARLDDDHGGIAPPGGLSVEVDTAAAVAAMPDRARYAFGAQFVEVLVDVDSGEVRVPRLLGVFAAGRIVNPVTARSQLIGGMIWGMSMALLEESGIDPAFGDFTARDLASYHVASHADIGSVEAHWIDEHEPDLGPAGAKGIGEIGIVGTAAAVANAVYHATGKRIRDLPIRLDQLL